MAGVTNLIAGGFRLKLAERGETLAISIPSVTVGSDFYTKYSLRRAARHVPLQDGREGNLRRADPDAELTEAYRLWRRSKPHRRPPTR